MGRPRTKHRDLPPHLHRKGNAYYYVARGTWTALGSDYAVALRKWAELHAVPAQAGTFADAVALYETTVLPTRAANTQRNYVRGLRNLLAVFGAMPLDAITSAHVAEYCERRSAEVRSDKFLLSAIFRLAQNKGLTHHNPCSAVRLPAGGHRDRYVSDAELRAFLLASPPILRDCLELAYLTGQRIGDILAWTRRDVQGGALHVRQQKTKAALRIELTGRLREVIDRCLARDSVRLVPMTYSALWKAFNAVRQTLGTDWRIHDLRGKAATDMGDLKLAQALLGHANRGMTERYVRSKAGEVVAPLERRILEGQG